MRHNPAQRVEIRFLARGSGQSFEALAEVGEIIGGSRGVFSRPGVTLQGFCGALPQGVGLQKGRG